MTSVSGPERIKTAGATQDRHVHVLTATVLGPPVAQADPRSMGKGRPTVYPNAPRLKPWRGRVQDAAEAAIAARAEEGAVFPMEGPVAVEATFTLRKPVAAPKRRRTWPIRKPDADKLVRAINDALTYAGVWLDDAQIVEEVFRKTYPREHPAALHVPGLVVTVYAVEDAREADGGKQG